MQSLSQPLFVADAAGLDFLNSVATVDERKDWISDGDGLLDWLEKAKLVPSEALSAFRAEALPGELDRVAERARALREWFRIFVRNRMGRPLPADALRELEPLNRLLQHDAGYRQIVLADAGDRRLELQSMRHCRSPDSLLLVIGATLAKFLCDEDFCDVKACEGSNCTLLFADHTRRRARRWCSMAVCGNRAKQTAHRNRIKSRR